MAELVYEEKMKVRFATAVANIHAPTVAEVNAAVDVTDFMTKDGYQPGVTNNKVDNDRLASAFDAQTPGSHGANLQLKFVRDDTPSADVARNLLGQRLTRGFVIVGYAGITPTVGQSVTVYPIATGHPIDQPSAKDENQKWICDCAVTSEPAWDVPIAA